jgi:acetyl esterase/lipase
MEVISANVGEFSPSENLDDPMLTVYAPTEPGPVPWPVVVFITGGGDLRSQGGPMSAAIAGMGAVVYTFSWSVDRVRWESVFGYVRCAIGMARFTAPDFGGDPSHLVLSGYAAGGGMGMSLALDMEAYPARDCTTEEDARPAQAFVGLDPTPLVPEDEFTANAGPDLEGAARALDPFPRIGSNPELLVRLVHGNYGPTLESIPRFSAALEDAGYDVEVLHDAETDHGLMRDPTSPGGRLGLQALWEVLQALAHE